MKKVVWLIVVLAIAGAGYGLFQWWLGPTIVPSGPTTARPVQAAPAAPAVPADPSAAASSSAPVAAPSTPASAPAAAPKRFEIAPGSSRATFTIYEELRGVPTNVVGATDQVAGELLLDPAHPASAQLGEIRINARTLATDNQNRNRAMQNRILETGQYEYITFTPRRITGLPERIDIGIEYPLQIEGDLTIRAITKPVVFAGAAKMASERQIVGRAETTVRRSEFDLQVPNLPFLANVADEVKLAIELQATAAE